jgi:ferritin-like metal-binding protein YciE
MPISSAHELFVHELGTIYDAEHQFVEGRQEMAQQASDQDLRSAIEEHIDQTEQHIQNLEHVFEQLGQQPQRATSEVAQGLVSEAQQNMQKAQNGALRDCAINAAVIKVEHFEMGSYRGLVTGAQQMGENEIVRHDFGLYAGEEVLQPAIQRPRPHWLAMHSTLTTRPSLRSR